VNSKACTQCRVEKPVGDFHRRKSAKDGLNPRCKPCNIADALGYAQRNAERVAAYQSEWTKRNPDKRKANIAAWRERNHEHAADLARQRAKRAVAKGTVAAWIAANPEKVRACKSRWKASNRDAVAADQARRRARELRAMPPWVDREAVNALYAEAAKVGLSVDHIVPLRSKVVCGLHVPANLRLLPLAENIAKNNRHWPDMP
jgi:hypothetical protein